MARTEQTDEQIVIKESDVLAFPGAVGIIAEYFDQLGGTPITGEQVAKFMQSVFVAGRYWTDATIDAELPDFPDWLE